MTISSTDKVLLLGYPIDRIPKEALEGTIMRLIEDYFTDGRPRYATTVTALALGQLAGFTLNHKVAPEVVVTLRRADFIGIDSKELALFSKLLGNTIDAIIHPEDLLLSSSSLLAKYNQSIFLLGGEEETCRETASALVEDFPGLKIAGLAVPDIHTKGLKLAASIEADRALIAAINEAKPTALALNIGHPKQEIWFERIRRQLKVPLVIGSGGGFERYLALRKKKEPSLFGSLSWPALARKGRSIFHYCLWMPPLFIYHTFSRFLYGLFHHKAKSPEVAPHLFLSSRESLYVIPLPPFVNRHTWDQHLNWIDAAMEYENLIVDFSRVRHLNPAGMGLLYTISKRAKNAGKNLFLIGINGDVRMLLKLHGAWDWFSTYVAEGPSDVLQKISINRGRDPLVTREFLAVDQIEDQTTLGFFGRIQGGTDGIPGFQLTSVIQGRNIILDLAYCTSITNSGFGFLLRLRKYQEEQRKSLMIKNVNRVVKNQFKFFKVDSYFNFI